jgi:hypothetical protein
MELTLPYRLYLLAYDTSRGRMAGGSYLGLVLRAAALAQLTLDGQLSDNDGRAVAIPGTHADPVLDAVKQDLLDSSPRTWLHWVKRNQRSTYLAIRERLDSALIIRAEPGRFLGLFPVTRVTMRDPLAVPRQREAVARALRSEIPISQLDRSDAIATALAASGGLRSAVNRVQARAAKQRIKELRELAGPVIPALRKAIQQRQAAS